MEKGRLNLMPFDKKQEHQHQCEFRIIIENTDNNSKLFKIGSIEKYSRLVSTKSIIKSTWTAKRSEVQQHDKGQI
jgi:hypothetical protein